MPLRELLLAMISTAVLCLGCNVISPPPMVPRHDGPRANDPGDVRIQLMVGLGGGIFVDGGLGSEVRISGQVTEEVAVGGGFGLAFNLEDHAAVEHGHPEMIFSLRGFGRFNPGRLEWLALDSGIGTTFADTGLWALHLDAGGVLGYEGPDDSELRGMVYAGPVVAVSIPLVPGDELLTVTKAHVETAEPGSANTGGVEKKDVRTTYFVGGTFGFGAESKDRDNVGGTLELSMLWAVSDNDDAVLVGASVGVGGTAPAE